MKSKFALALDLLEQEVEVLSREEQMHFIGGDGYDSNGYDSNGYDSNGNQAPTDDIGYCFFQAMSYSSTSLGCNTLNHYDYKGLYEEFTDNDPDEFSYTGNTFNGITNSAHATAFMNTYFNTSNLNNGTNLYNYMHDTNNAGKPIMSSMYTGDHVGGDKTAHDVIIKSQNTQGQFEVYDVYTKKTSFIEPGKIVPGTTYGINSCK